MIGTNVAQVCGITTDNYIQLQGSRPSVKFDVLSIDIGSAPSMSTNIRSSEPRTTHMSTAKTAPLQDFAALRVEQLRHELKQRNLDTTGRKKELVERLTMHNRASSEDVPVVTVTPVKPIDRFSARWDVIVARVVTAAASRACTHIVVVGGGAGGVELALSMQARLQDELGNAGFLRDGACSTPDLSV